MIHYKQDFYMLVRRNTNYIRNILEISTIDFRYFKYLKSEM